MDIRVLPRSWYEILNNLKQSQIKELVDFVNEIKFFCVFQNVSNQNSFMFVGDTYDKDLQTVLRFEDRGNVKNIYFSMKNKRKSNEPTIPQKIQVYEAENLGYFIKNEENIKKTYSFNIKRNGISNFKKQNTECVIKDL